MKVIIPMAGRGSRLRPHTLTLPKPLIPVGGKPIVHRLVEDIASVCSEQIEEIGFIIGDFGKEVEQELIQVAERLGAKGSIFYQDEALGTAHAVLCAKSMLSGPVVVAFADTLFKADFKIDSQIDGILWVKQIEDPSSFGVVKMDGDGHIIDFVEKPETFVSDLAMIGVYYFKSGEDLLVELNYLVDNKIIKSGEYQLPDALRRLTEKGKKFKPGEVQEWLDCGNKEVTVHTNKRVLDYDFEKKLEMVHPTAKVTQTIIIPPCYIGENVVISNSVIGPHVSVGKDSHVNECIIKNSILQKNTEILNANIENSMIGNFAKYNGIARDISMSDYSTID
ncbi:MAG: nucleotidyltransferase [Crocinitomicaceae bacterium]|jgi:glucose-1-phosphate thymidylyltransferase|nr:nucleotidyltransferase [Crocinitomicaceae bacterium]